jgi:membrane protein
VKYLKIFVRSIIDFIKDGGLILAGSLSYFTMMALVPFCLFLITIFGYFLGHYQTFYQFFFNRLSYLFPDITSEITEQLGNLIAFKGLGAFSFILYGFLSLPLFSSMENAMNIIFKVEKKRTFFWSLLISLLILTLIIFMLSISFSASSLIHLLKASQSSFPELRIGLITGFLLRYLVPFIMVLFTTMIVYLFFPKAKVRTRHALVGALFTTILLEIAKHFFTWYVGTVVQFGTIYGPLTAFIVFLLWVFYSSCILLIGAEIVHNLGIYRK